MTTTLAAAYLNAIDRLGPATPLPDDPSRVTDLMNVVIDWFEELQASNRQGSQLTDARGMTVLYDEGAHN